MDTRHAAIARLLILVVLIINQTLITMGWSPLPFDDQQIEAGINSLLLTVAALWAWWKNSPMTDEAREMQEHLEQLKKRKGGRL